MLESKCSNLLVEKFLQHEHLHGGFCATRASRMVLMAILEDAWERGHQEAQLSADCYASKISHAEIALFVGLADKKTVRRHVRRLEANGLVKVEVFGGVSGKKRDCCRYTFPWLPSAAVEFGW
jgi:hypothetical protein